MVTRVHAGVDNRENIFLWTQATQYFKVDNQKLIFMIA